jgi:hypothetical protein
MTMIKPPVLSAGISLAEFRERRDALRHRPIAVRLERDLEAVDPGPAHQVPQLRLAQLRQPAGGRCLGIRRLEQGAARGQCPVGAKRHAAQP